MVYAILAVLVVYIVFRILTSRPDVSGKELNDLVANGGKLVDVRSVSEFRNGHIPEAVNIPLERLPEGLKSHGITLDTCILLYCASGMRSGSAKRILKKAGYTNALNAGAFSSLSL